MHSNILTNIAKLALRASRSISYRAQALYIQSWLSLLGVKFKGKCVFSGCPIIDIFPNSTISVGKNVRFISTSFSTALGVNHRVIIKTLTGNGKIIIGNNVGISGGSICAAHHVEIGDDTLIGANVTIADTDFHSLDPARRSDPNWQFSDATPVIIGKNVFIGTGAIILKGVHVGDNSVIGAGSVVTKNISDNVIAAGNPCRIISHL